MPPSALFLYNSLILFAPIRSGEIVLNPINLRDKTKRKSKYAKTQPLANALLRQLEAVEVATATGIARREEIEEWLDRKWLTTAEAEVAFPGFMESLEREQILRKQAITNYDAIWSAFENQAWCG